MGILNFLKTVRKLYPNCVKSKFIDSYDNLYIDLNHALYHVVSNSSTKKDVITNLKNYLFYIIDKAKPKNTIYICSDGVAPLAKMVEQRKRRIDRNKLDLSMNFTAGTKFMLELESNIEDFKIFLEKMLSVKVVIDIISDGEGEVKIKKHLNLESSSKKSLIFSGDSDMVLILLLSDEINNLYQMVNKDEIISIQKMYDDHIKNYALIEKDNTKEDLVFIFLLSGNDYLPKAKNFNLENYLKSYHKIISKLKSKSDGLTKFDGNTLEINYVNLHVINYYSSQLNKKNYKYDMNQNNKKYNEIYQKYFYGLTWCMNMYKTGICHDYQFIYDCDEPHTYFLSLYLSKNNKFSINKSEPIDFKLYGILLIPKYASELIDDDQRRMSEDIDSEFNIYEEETCQICKNLKNQIKMTNEKYRACSKITSNTYDILKDDIKDELDENDIKNTLESYKDKYWKKLKELKLQLSKQKKKYKPLNSKKIKKIEKYFQKIK